MAHFDGMDASIRPQDDFFRHVNGAWLNANVIPGDKESFGTFDIVQARVEENVRELVEAAARCHLEDESETRLLGDFYASQLDVETIERSGLAPLAADLGKIDRIGSLAEVAEIMASFIRIGVRTPIGAGVAPDGDDPDRYAVHLWQSGLGLPDRSFYLAADGEGDALLSGYQSYLARLASLGRMAAPVKAAQAVVVLEKCLAAEQWCRTDLRDPVRRQNQVKRNQLTTLFPGFPWDVLTLALGVPREVDSVIVGQPSYLAALGKLARRTPIATWRSYLRLGLLDRCAPDLGSAFREACFHFRGERLCGLAAEPPRWQRAIEVTSDLLGEAIGQRYVVSHFPASGKARVADLVGNVRSAFAQSLETLPWLTPATREAALRKLESIEVKLGFPDRWRGYAGLETRRDEALQNQFRTHAYLFGRDMAEAGGPVDRSRWPMDAQAVGAGCNLKASEITFPAGLLQPPFFDPEADDAFNYGAIGSIIGHEISHCFDDQGRHFDAFGRLRDWWTSEDAERFAAQTRRLVDQYGAFDVGGGLKVNGHLTLGENIADISGVSIAFRAYQLSLGGQAAPVIDGLAAEQRFFLGYGRLWRNKNREETRRALLEVDPHSPEEFRTNGVLSNVDAFYRAFDLRPGDKLYRCPEDRVCIW